MAGKTGSGSSGGTPKKKPVRKKAPAKLNTRQKQVIKIAAKNVADKNNLKAPGKQRFQSAMTKAIKSGDRKLAQAYIKTSVQAARYQNGAQEAKGVQRVLTRALNNAGAAGVKHGTSGTGGTMGAAKPVGTYRQKKSY